MNMDSLSSEHPFKRRRIETDASSMEQRLDTLDSRSEANATGEGTSASHPQQKTKGKEKKNKGRRDRRATLYQKEDRKKPLTEEGPEQQAGPKAPRLPKRQCALLIGFCGSGYSGMQMCVSYVFCTNFVSFSKKSTIQPAASIENYRGNLVPSPRDGRCCVGG
jgi:tRNA pseudouridine38-40 synthase